MASAKLLGMATDLFATSSEVLADVPLYPSLAIGSMLGLGGLCWWAMVKDKDPDYPLEETAGSRLEAGTTAETLSLTLPTARSLGTAALVKVEPIAVFVAETETRIASEELERLAPVIPLHQQRPNGDLPATG